MRVLVTGGSGRLGRYVVREFSASGHEVTSLDVIPASDRIENVRYLSGDVSHVEDVYGALSTSGADGVVHFAAWSNAGIVADTRTYADNVTATFNLLHVCANAGVRRVICASSAQVYGFERLAPVYVPVDENHPLRPLNAYALSKIACEGAAAYFAERTPNMSVLSFRIMGAREPAELPGEIEALARAPGAGQFLLWTRTDSRDVATACRLALEVEPAPPSGTYNIAGREIALDEDAAALVKRHCGGSTEIRPGLVGQASPLSCARARAAFGYEPRYVWSTRARLMESGS